MSDFAARRTTMVDTQVRPSDVTKFPVIEAMLAVPMEDFVPPSRRAVAYSGENLDLGEGRVLLEPRTLGKMIDMLSRSRKTPTWPPRPSGVCPRRAFSTSRS